MRWYLWPHAKKPNACKAGIMAVRNDDGDPVMGNPNGSLTVYEFSDYNCGYCKRMFAPIMQMLASKWRCAHGDQGISNP